MKEMFEYNKLAYEKMRRDLDERKRACVIHCTGLGKTVIVLRYILDELCSDKRFLIVTEGNILKEQFEDKISAEKRLLENEGKYDLADKLDRNVKVAIYPSLENRQAFMGYDVIILDEMHCCGAEMTSEFVRDLLTNNPEALLIGTTATSRRHDGQDMAEELFDGQVSSDIDLYEAIMNMGVLPKPDFVTCIYDERRMLREEVELAEMYGPRSLLSATIKRACAAMASAQGVEAVFEKTLKYPNGKYIVFCKDGLHLKNMIGKAKNTWFKWLQDKGIPVHIFAEYYKELNMGLGGCDKFRSCTEPGLKLLFSVNRCIHGLHSNDFNGVINLRPAFSEHLYQQIIGRPFHASENAELLPPPQIYDIVDTIELLYRRKPFGNAHGCSRKICFVRSGAELQALADMPESREKLPGDGEDIDDMGDIGDMADIGETKVGKDNVDIDGIGVKSDNVDVDGNVVGDNGVNIGELGNAMDSAGTDIDETYDENDNVDMNGYKDANYGVDLEGCSDVDDYDEINKYTDKKYPGENKTKDYVKTSVVTEKIQGKTKKKKDTEMSSDELNSLVVRTYFSSDRVYECLKELRSIMRRRISWDESFSRACLFYEKYHHFNVPRGTLVEGFDLYGWYMVQKYNYHHRENGRITDEQIRLLESIGIDWESDPVWDERFFEYRNLVEKYNTACITKKKCSVNSAIPNWLSYQRRRLSGKTGRPMKRSEYDKLNSLGMVWNSRDIDSVWAGNYSKALRFFEDNHHICVPSSGPTEYLYRWLRDQWDRFAEYFAIDTMQEAVNDSSYVGVKNRVQKEIDGNTYVGVKNRAQKEVYGNTYVGIKNRAQKEIDDNSYVGVNNRAQKEIDGNTFVGINNRAQKEIDGNTCMVVNGEFPIGDIIFKDYSENLTPEQVEKLKLLGFRYDVSFAFFVKYQKYKSYLPEITDLGWKSMYRWLLRQKEKQSKGMLKYGEVMLLKELLEYRGLTPLMH